MSDNVFRNGWDAAINRANSLEAELRDAKGQQTQDAQRISHLEAQLAASRRAIEHMQASMHAPMAQPMPVYQSSNAMTALVLGILGIMFCNVLGPIAWHYGNQEIMRIEAGLVDPSNGSAARAGRILGIISTVILCGAVLFGLLAAILA